MEGAIDLVVRAGARGIRVRRDDLLAAHHAFQAHLAHQPLHGATRGGDAVTAQRMPDLPGAVDPAIA